MELSFNNRQLRNIIENEQTAIAELGAIVAQSLKNRVADIRAAENIYDLPLGEPVQLSSSDYRQIDLAFDHKLIICPNHVKLPRNKDETVDWRRVTRVKFIRIERP